MVPLVVRLGVVPPCCSVRSPPLTLIVPLFTCAAPARLIVNALPSVTVPWLFSSAPSVRVPPAPTCASIVAPAALVSVPLGMFSTAPNEPSVSVSTIAPLFVKLEAIVRFEMPSELSPTSRSVAPLTLLSAALILLVPWTSSRPWFATGALMVLDFTSNVVPGSTVSVPVPPTVSVVRLNGTAAVLRLCVSVTDPLENVIVPGPAIEPAVYANEPPETATLSPLPMLIAAAFVNDGDVPVWRIVNFAPTPMVPALVCAADALFSVSA